MKKLNILLTVLILCFATFANANPFNPNIRFGTSSSDTCSTAVNTSASLLYSSKQQACVANNSTHTGTPTIGTACNGSNIGRCTTSANATTSTRVVPRLQCPANSTVTGSQCTCDAGYTHSNGSCINTSCQSPQVWNAQTLQCENPAGLCDNTTNQVFDYLATDDADSQNIVLKPVSSYEYLCNASCKYYLDGNTNRCYVLANDSPPRAGYCEQNYVPTFQSCTVGIETPAPLEHTPPADITTCPTNHTLNAFDVCIPDNISCPPDQAVNNQNICENVACQNGYE